MYIQLVLKGGGMGVVSVSSFGDQRVEKADGTG